MIAVRNFLFYESAFYIDIQNVYQKGQLREEHIFTYSSILRNRIYIIKKVPLMLIVMLKMPPIR